MVAAISTVKSHANSSKIKRSEDSYQAQEQFVAKIAKNSCPDGAGTADELFFVKNNINNIWVFLRRKSSSSQ